mgnify:FL=1
MQIIIHKSIIQQQQQTKQLDLSFNNENEQKKRLLRVSSAPKQEYQIKNHVNNKSSRSISTFHLIRKRFFV